MVLELRDAATPATRRTTAYKVRRLVEKSLMRSYRFPTMKPTATRKTSDLPIRFRPAFIALTFVCLILLALLGFHPTLSGKLRVHDKIQRTQRLV